uniref:RNA binding protein, mRNA processing factor 2b n=1 Tax=Salmo trutta TaxID=8032 RepID=A0A674CFC2_SALTR
MSLKSDSEPNNNVVSMEEEVRTLFVSGLPVDIKPRELYLLFRPFKVGQNIPVGFVTFDNRTGAEAAKNALNMRWYPSPSETSQPGWKSRQFC